MCQSCMNAETGDLIDSVGQLSEICGGFDRLILRAPVDPELTEHLRADPENCLCHVDIANTLIRWDFIVWAGDFRPEYYFATRAACGLADQTKPTQ